MPDYFEEVNKYLDDVGNNIHQLKQELIEIRKGDDYKDKYSHALHREIAEKAAYILAVDDLTGDSSNKGSIASRTLISAAMEACEKSGEYDYGPLKDRLLSAIQQKIGNILFISSAGHSLKSPQIKLDMKQIGQQEQWIAAAQKTREQLGVGIKTRGKVHKESGEDLPSRFWREKIYLRAQGDFGDEMAERVPDVLRDLKEKFPGVSKPKTAAGKYAKTIETRLSMVGKDQAPYWEILNNGNIGIMTGTGTAYPIVPPTRFKQKAEQVLKEIFKISWDIYYRQAMRWLEPPGREPPDHAPPPRLPIEERVQHAMEMASKGVKLFPSTEPVTKRTITREYEFINNVLTTFEIYQSGGKIYYRSRGEGGKYIRNILRGVTAVTI